LEIIAWRSFDEFRYELNGVKIDRNRNVEITNIKNYASMTYDKALIALNTGWNFRYRGFDIEEG